MIIATTIIAHHQASVHERKNQKNYLKRTRNLLEAKRYSGNHIGGINTWAGLLVRYSVSFLKCAQEEHQQMDQITRKLMTVRKLFYPRDNLVCAKERRKKRTFKITAMHRYYDLKTAKNYHKERPITATRKSPNNLIKKKTNRTTVTKKNNSIDISGKNWRNLTCKDSNMTKKYKP